METEKRTDWGDTAEEACKSAGEEGAPQEREINSGLLRFIEASPSAFHVAENLRQRLLRAGFKELRERDGWRLRPGEGYFTLRGGSSLIAFRLPGREPEGFHIGAVHSDSPAFKVKEGPEIWLEDKYAKLNTEKYGGMILSAWLDRPLSVAGRLALAGPEGEVETRLVHVDRDLLVIPSLAVHMNRDMNKGMELNPQTDMLPLLGMADLSAGKGALRRLLAEAAGVAPEDILDQDIYVYVREKGRILGEKGELILSPRLDDLQCVYAAAEGFASARPERFCSVLAVFDNEEVGSGSAKGADSTFLEDVLERISLAAGPASGSENRAAGCSGSEEDPAGLPGREWEVSQSGRERYLRQIAGSFLISADNAHAVHPNRPEKADPVNRPYLNGGIVLKYHGGLRYTTDAVSAARFKLLCQKAGVPCQIYTNRSDIAGGSTLGHISAAHVSVPSVDIGLPQLAMHSAVETAGSADTGYAVRMFQTFYGE